MSKFGLRYRTVQIKIKVTIFNGWAFKDFTSLYFTHYHYETFGLLGHGREFEFRDKTCWVGGLSSIHI